jgi:hypothetical protein
VATQALSDKAANSVAVSSFKGFSSRDGGLYLFDLFVAGWLHDCLK